VEQSDNQVLFLNGPRFQKGGQLKLRISLSQQNSPFVAAVKGIEGTYSGRDYNGTPVLASLNHVPDSPWYLIAKINNREVFNLWDLQGAWLTGLAVGLLSIVVVLAALIWQRRSETSSNSDHPS